MPAVLAAALASILFLTSCITYAPKGEGKWVWGQNLAVRVQQIERKGTVAYSRDGSYYLLEPSSPDRDIVALLVEVYQDRSGVILLTPTSSNVNLKYGKESEVTPVALDQGKPVSQEAAAPYLLTPAFDKSLPLPRGNSVTGWIIFQMPKGVAPTALVWDDSDHVVVPLAGSSK